MDIDDFMALSNEQRRKTCAVVSYGSMYAGVFSGITFNEELELCMCLKWM